MVYKLINKVIINQLKTILPRTISPTHSACMLGLVIMDNILISYEVFHSMHSQACKNGSMAIKLDMSKAYDRVE